MLNFKNDYFKTEAGRNLYPTEFKDFSKVEVFGSKLGGPSGQEASANIYKIPKSYYKYNAGNIDFTNFPNGVASIYQTIKIVFYENLFSLDINFTGDKDITPKNLQETFEKVGVALKDMQNRLSKVALYVDSSEPGQINLPKLPNSSIWYRDSDGNISSLPIEKFHNKFSELINEIYSAVEKKLDAKVIQLDKEQEAYFETLKQKLLEIEARIALMQEHSYVDVPYMGKDLIMVYIEDDGTYRECNHLQQEPRDAVGIVVTVDGTKKTRCYFNGVYDLPASMANYRAGTYWQSDNTRTELTLTEPLIWKSIAFKVAGGKIYFDVGNPILLTSQEGAILFAEFETISQANSSPEKFPYIRVLGDKVVDDGGQGAYKWNGKSYEFIGADKQLQILEAKGIEEVAKITAEGTTQINKIQATGIDAKADKDQVYQLPHPSCQGAFYVEGGRLYGYGNLANPTSLYQARRRKHGNTSIYTSADGKFQLITYLDSEGKWKIYTGLGYKNLIDEAIFSKAFFTGYATIVGNVLSYTQTQKGGWVPFPINFQRNKTITISFDCQENILFTGNIGGGGTLTFTNINNHYKVKIVCGDVYYGYIVCLGVNVPTTLHIRNLVCVEGTDEKPSVPPQYTVQPSSLSFEGTENLDFIKDSYILKNSTYSTGSFVRMLYNKDGSLYTTLENLKQDVLYSSSYTSDYNIANKDRTDIITIKPVRGVGEISSFSQFINYNKPLTQVELETDRAKNLIFKGATDLTSVVEENMKVSAILGDIPRTIQDGGNWTVDNIAFDLNTWKYYICTANNSDTSIDLQKWKEWSLKELKSEIDINTSKLEELVPLQRTKLLTFGGFDEYNSTSKLLAIPKIYTLFCIFDNTSNGGGPAMKIGTNGISLGITEATFRMFSEDDQNYYYYFDGGSGAWDNKFCLFVRG